MEAVVEKLTTLKLMIMTMMMRMMRMRMMRMILLLKIEQQVTAKHAAAALELETAGEHGQAAGMVNNLAVAKQWLNTP